jgi:hypothetical protein
VADLGVQINLWMHVIGSVAIIAAARSPAAPDWLMQRL